MNNVVLVICPQLHELGEEAPWESNQSYCFYLLNLSTRGLEVWHDQGMFNVRVLTLAHYAEWELVFQMLDFAVKGENALISTDSEVGQLRLHNFREVVNADFIVGTTWEHAACIINTIHEENRVIVLPGPIYQTSIGLWVAENLPVDDGSTEGRDAILETLFGMMLLTNYFGSRPEYEQCTMPRESNRKLANGQQAIAVAIEPGESNIVGEFDFLVFNDEANNPIAISSQEYREVLGNYFRMADELMWFDEYMFALGPISRERYYEFVHAVKPVSLPLPPKDNPLSKLSRGIGASLKLIKD